MTLEQTLRAAVQLGCLYEVAAIATRRVPTITRITHLLRGHPVLRWLVLFPIWGYATYHFFTEDSGT